jgi:hypothetical protein
MTAGPGHGVRRARRTLHTVQSRRVIFRIFGRNDHMAVTGSILDGGFDTANTVI